MMMIFHEYSRHQMLREVLLNHADQRTQKIACIFQPYGVETATKLTYGELNQRVLERSHLFVKLGLQDNPVALLYPSGLDFIINFLACLYSGVIAIPLKQPRNPQQMRGLVSILDDANVKSILTTVSTELVLKQQLQKIPELTDRRWFWINERNVELDNSPLPFLSLNRLAFIQYTSGSISTPKGVMVNHGNLLENLKAIQEAYGYSEELVGGGWLPHFHDMGLVGQMLQPLLSGGTYVFMPPLNFVQRPIRWLELISQYHFHSSASPNFGYKHCLTNINIEEDLSHLDLSSWRVALNGSEPIDADTMKSFSERFQEYGFNPRAFAPTYGLAECTLFVSGSPPLSGAKTLTLNEAEFHKGRVQASSHGKDIVSCGLISSQFRVKIVDPKTKRLCKKDEIGEVWISGTSVSSGYFNNGSLTEECFHASLQEFDGYYYLRTGDTGFIYEEMLYITGRIKDLLIINGRNIYPYDIELTCNSHPYAAGNNGAAVFSIEHNQIIKVIALVEIQKKILSQCNKNLVVAELRENIMKIHDIAIHDIILVKPGTIPKTTSGKIKRNQCKDLLTFDIITMNSTNKTRDMLLHVINLHLSTKLSDFSLNEHSDVSFSSLGLGSADHVELTGVIEDYLQVKIEPTLAFDYPTVNALVDFLDENFITVTKTKLTSESSIS